MEARTPHFMGILICRSICFNAMTSSKPHHFYTVCSVKVWLLQDFRICEMTFEHIHGPGSPNVPSCPIITSHGDSSPHRSVLWPGVNWLPSVTRRLNRCWRSERKTTPWKLKMGGPWDNDTQLLKHHFKGSCCTPEIYHFGWRDQTFLMAWSSP